MKLIDSFSAKILEILRRDSRQTVQQISEQVGLSATPCWKRIKDMEAQGVITGYTVRFDRKKLGFNLLVQAEVNLAQHTEKLVAQFEDAVQSTPNIVRCYSTTGQADYVLTIMATDIEEYERFLVRTLFKLPAVAHVRTSIVLREVKLSSDLPV